MPLIHVGLDIGSTTAKAVVLDSSDKIVLSRYTRHFADINTTVNHLISEISDKFAKSTMTIALAGSGALSIAEEMKLPFTQELVACSASIGRYLPGIDVCIELGGEDAKLTYFDSAAIDQRMNETCAGGTGAFIDQMATLLGTDAAGLNELAKGYNTIYPVASRCGVFAKTDIQPLINDGAARSDIAASIFQAIVNQTISGLACGRKIAGKVAFLGGPLYFLSELRKRFTETLELKPDDCIFPENPHLFVALGAAILGKKSDMLETTELHETAAKYFSTKREVNKNILPALFLAESDRREFNERHSGNRVTRKPLADYRGNAYLGIDVGSTTIKVVLLGEEGELLYSRYFRSGGGEPLKNVRESLLEIYAHKNDGTIIAKSCATGYGEKLVQAAFGIDFGEVETVAHAKAAEYFMPGVEFVVDIGGQDMKCLSLKDGVIDKVFLNEACSSGCGSFLSSFAESMDLSLEEFVRLSLESLMPVDLGSRCTVFMNSRVRQAQKEGAAVADIAAGLAYSVVKNALYKVLKIRSVDDLGQRIVVQGGAFKNDALLRAFELVTGRDVIRPEISELMGAFGAALIARDDSDGRTSTADLAELQSFTSATSSNRCGGCGNRCILTHTKFGDGKSYVSGNRCENGNSQQRKKNSPPNVFAEKYRRLFDYYKPLEESEAVYGTIGMPRVLNMYENYPLWFSIFTALGFRVLLSDELPNENLGMDTIPSQTICYPAKLAHRHIEELAGRGVKRIFYPIMQKESNEFADAHQNFNCPVVTGYPDVAALNIDSIKEQGIEFLKPDLSIDSSKVLKKQLHAVFARYGIARSAVDKAVEAGYAEYANFKKDVAALGRAALDWANANGATAIVLAGHPYHLDPEVNHGIPEVITGYGAAVLTEDSVCERADELDWADPLYVVDQWVYHSRLYRTASVIARHPEFKNVQMVQLNSFGCGLDAISADQSAELLEKHGKLHTLIKIDEGKNNGAVRIRIRSLLAAARQKEAQVVSIDQLEGPKDDNALAAKEARSRTILCPSLCGHHFQFLQTAMQGGGFDFQVLPEGGRDAVELGLKYVNNDACYPAMVVVGQFIKALQSGEYDPETTDCLYAQTGGACRASNYVPLLRRALDAAGYESVRILTVNSQQNSGALPFNFDLKSAWRGLLGLMYGDLLMRLSLRTRPYETVAGSTDALYDDWVARCNENIRNGSWFEYGRNVAAMVKDFEAIEIDGVARPRVGIVGEILVKYHNNANERLIEIIESEGGEAVVPDLSGFLYYCLFDNVYANEKLSGSFIGKLIGKSGISVLDFVRKPLDRALKNSRFGCSHSIYEMARQAGEILSCANQGGEGWFLTAEMVNLIEGGVKNIVCVQPFACLPNHITGKGVIKELKRLYRGANILPLDYDSSVSTVNQLNRLKLLMAVASGQ